MRGLRAALPLSSDQGTAPYCIEMEFVAQQSLNDRLVLAVLPQGRSRTVPQCLWVDSNDRWQA